MFPSSALGLFLILPFEPQPLQSNSCLSNSFYGNYRDGKTMRSVFKFSHDQQTCFYAYGADTPGSYKLKTVREPQQLIWMESQDVDESLKPQKQLRIDDWLMSFLDRLPLDAQFSRGSQKSLHVQSEPSHESIIWASNTAALVSLSSDLSRDIDMYLPRFWKSTILPSAPTSYHSISSSSEKLIERIASQLRFDPEIASMVNNISLPQIKNDVRFLTGEDGTSGIITRHSFSSDARVAANWLKYQFEETGANCELRPFLPGFAPNVICRYRAVEETNATVVLGAHYDSRGSFGFMNAPGGNDDGSGTASLLSIARTIARKGLGFRTNVEFCAFAGEEQGLLGSRAYARQLRKENANVILMIQADMLAYHAFQEPPQLGIPDLIGSPAAAELVIKAAALYSPELQVGITPACCSDHQSFHEQGYVATQVFERAGPIKDPMYHNSGDLSEREGYDFDQVRSIAKVQFAALLHTSGYEMQ
ncbi:hypothetical protein AX17_000997 [Amanita inopinata Kibby_2008]|nr:hypothetical protein AX17_000997 [Amanita inopinata Kibby_2008]